MRERGIDATTIQHFEIGYAPDAWETVGDALKKARVPGDVGERVGLLKPGRRGGHYDLLRGRVTFPICDVRGRVIGFGGRVLSSDQEPKYLNTPETAVFSKGTDGDLREHHYPPGTGCLRFNQLPTSLPPPSERL